MLYLYKLHCSIIAPYLKKITTFFLCYYVHKEIMKYYSHKLCGD